MQSVATNTSRWSRYIRPALLVLLLASVGWHAWDLSRPGLLDRQGRLKCADFLQFYTYGSLVDAGQSASLYDPAAHARVARNRVDPQLHFDDFHPNYSPVVAWAMAPVARLPFLTAMAVCGGVSVLLYVFAAAWLTRQTPALNGYGSTLWLAVAAWPTIFWVVRYGQISTVALLLLAAAVWMHSRGRGFLAGAALGVLVYKPTLIAVPILVFAAAGEGWLLSGLLIGAAAETSLAIWLAGSEVFLKYMRTLAALAAHPELVQLLPAESHSIRGAVRLFIPVEWLASAAGLLALVAVVVAAVFVWRRRKDPRLRWATLTLATLAGSPHLLTYDLVLLAVPLILLTDWWLEQGCSRKLGPWTAVLLMFYGGAWPGTMLARMYQVQISTIAMVMAMWLIVRYSSEVRLARGTGSSSSPSMSS